MVNRSIRISKTIKRVSREALQALNYQDVLYEFPSVLSIKKTSLVLKTPKTVSSIREVYLPETLIAILYEFYQSRKHVNTLSVFPDLIFCYEDGRPIQETTLTKHFHTALERAGLPYHFIACGIAALPINWLFREEISKPCREIPDMLRQV